MKIIKKNKIKIINLLIIFFIIFNFFLLFFLNDKIQAQALKKEKNKIIKNSNNKVIDNNGTLSISTSVSTSFIKNNKKEIQIQNNNNNNNINDNTNNVIGILNNKIIENDNNNKNYNYILINKTDEILINKYKEYYFDRHITINIYNQPLYMFIDVFFGKIKYEIIDKEILNENFTFNIYKMSLNDILNDLFKSHHIYYKIKYIKENDDIIFSLYRYKEKYINIEKNNNININELMTEIKTKILSEKSTIIYLKQKNIIYVKDYQSNIDMLEKFF